MAIDNLLNFKRRKWTDILSDKLKALDRRGLIPLVSLGAAAVILYGGVNAYWWIDRKVYFHIVDADKDGMQDYFLLRQNWFGGRKEGVLYRNDGLELEDFDVTYKGEERRKSTLKIKKEDGKIEDDPTPIIMDIFEVEINGKKHSFSIYRDSPYTGF